MLLAPDRRQLGLDPDKQVADIAVSAIDFADIVAAAIDFADIAAPAIDFADTEVQLVHAVALEQAEERKVYRVCK